MYYAITDLDANLFTHTHTPFLLHTHTVPHSAYTLYIHTLYYFCVGLFHLMTGDGRADQLSAMVRPTDINKPRSIN